MAYRCNIFYAVLFMVLYLCIPSCTSTQLVTPNTLNNIVVDKTTGNLYIGGINFLLKTNSDLIVIKSNTTGPLPDSEKCDPAPEVCKFKRVPTDNYNKVLLIHESKKQLVVCGNVYYGECELRDMDTLERVPRTLTGMIASRYVDIPAAGIISNGPFDEKVFYIATSWTKSAYKDMSYEVSAISTRTLDQNKKFDLVVDGGKVSELKFKDQSYKVSYVYGFSSGRFNYFITVQESRDSYKKKTSDPNDNVYETKISHFCHKDETYITYVEMPLKCLSKNGTDFNIVTSAFVAKPGTKLAAKLGITTDSDVVFVTFSKSNIGSRKPLAESALCYYSITEIEAVIEENAKKCFQDNIVLGMPWINDDRKCAREAYRGSCPSPFSSTGNHPIGGSISLSKQAIMEHNNLVSITALAYEEYTAVLLGDSAGNLLKVSIGDDIFPAQPYHKKAIAPGEPIKKLVLSNDQLSVYTATRNKVLKLPIEDCSSHSTCQSCTGHGDPFCGWCSLYRKCSRRALCANADVHPLRFTTNVSQCIEFASIQPPRFSHGSVTKLEATIQSLPPAASGQNYKCYFNKIERATTVFANSTVRCITPPASDLPRITSPTGDIMIDLSLYSSESGRLFVSTKIAFYNCSLMKGCIVCSESDYDCDWCTYQGKCYADGNSYCPKSGEIVLSKKKRPVGAVGCPYIEGNQSFLLPNKISKPIVLKAKHLPVNKYNYEYKCLLMVEDDNRPFEVDATRDSDTSLTCQPYKYSYMASQRYYSAKLKVLWRRTEEIQKPDTVTVSLYKCNVNRNDCSTCLVADSRLECGWCKADINSCKVKEACNQVWVHPSQFCNTMPIIKRFWPITGPPQGGTEVEIDGVDFGKQFSDIERSVTIANYTCIPDPHKYIVSKKIICNTTRSGGDVEGSIKVDVNNFIGVSTSLFSYQTPEIEDFHPKKGPASGGSSVNITGVKLNTGRKIMVWLGDTPCLVDRAKVTNISIPCVTQPTSVRSRRAVSNDSSSSSSGDVVVSFDGYKPPSPSVKFEFTADPVFYNIKPDRTFPSGGLRLTVTGKYLDSVQVPKIFFVKAADRSVVSKPEICTIISSTTMYCPSPNVTSFGVAPGSSNGSEVIVGLIMDNVQGLNNVTTLAITADPYIEPFEKGTQINENLVLILTGNNLDILQKDEILVTIEGVPCNLTSLDEKQLVCNAPKKSELPKIEDGDLDYTVIVKAAFLTFYPGKVKYREMPIQSKFPMLYIYIGVGVGVFIFLLVIICLVCAYRKKKRQQSRNIQEFEMRIDNLEIKVAKECREAFAELQTDMTDWTSDLSSARMPFWGFRTYALHVLFPGVVDHPVLTMKSNLTPNWENGLRKFSQLIQNKDFLLIFVRTLEQQNSFNMKDRCNLASLLMVALQAKMEYATDILKQLLCDLIRKSVAQSHPKLLLRRTESVAEKLLTNWLAFCMYNHLKEESGKPLFMLFMAIKGQIEKGPVDMLTGEARYSLSEDKLLRHAIEYEVLKMSVSQDDEPPISVSLLNIDTITQAKQKILDAIHKHEPFSSRPKQNNFQLSWMSKDGVEKVLMDDDASSVIEGPWRRLNTLEHYKVPNDAFLKLSTHHTHFYGSTSSDLQLHSIPRSTFKPFSYTPLSRGSKEDLLEGGGRIWHLVKQQDYSAEQQEDKMLSEIYLTRLLATKGTLQKFVSGLFDAIFSVNRPNLKTPIAVKLMFDLLDKHAQELNLSDPEVLHTWKNNSLPLRFWINIVKNPNFIFDVHKGGTVDSCLSVIAQLFMDSCSTSEHRLGVDSPSNKLLYAKEIPSYKKHVESYYSNIRLQATPSENELSDFFADLSMQYGKMFNSDIALKELFRYVVKYQDPLQEKLEECGLPKLASNLEYIVAEIADD